MTRGRKNRHRRARLRPATMNLWEWKALRAQERGLRYYELCLELKDEFDRMGIDLGPVPTPSDARAAIHWWRT